MPPKAEAQPKFACEEEAALLLNCIAAADYVEHKCVQYMKKLRKCVQKERIVNFDISPCEPADTSSTDKSVKEEQEKVQSSSS
jgi:hypothetical protein